MNLEDWLGMSILPSPMKTDHQQAWALLPRYIHVGEILKLTLTLSYEAYCYYCYRRESQLEDGAKLNACQYHLERSISHICRYRILQDAKSSSSLPLGVFGRRTSGLVSNHQVSCTCSTSNTPYCGQIH